MAITVQIFQYTGGTNASPGTTSTVQGGSFKWTRDDLGGTGGSAPVPTPSTSNTTNFSWVKSLVVNIQANAGALTMTNLKIGRTADYPISGVKVWFITSHNATSQYVVASSANQPATDNASNNANAPTLNGVVSQAMPLLSAAAVYALSGAGQSSTGLVNPMVEMVLGVDSGNSTAGTQTVCTLRWQWTEQ